MAPPAIVLDTHVVLDWLFFKQGACEHVASAILGGMVSWIVTPAMRDELHHVLARRTLDRWRTVSSSAVWDTWDRHAITVNPGGLGETGHQMRCTDVSDQKFIDLALSSSARWLLSRDRAVLKLSRRATPKGLQILTPEAWLPPQVS